MPSNIATQLNLIRSEIKEIASASGRTSDAIELVAVTKTHPAEAIREAIEAGQLIFGESKLQEAKSKIPDLPAHLQSNKVRQALPLFELFHSIDSLELLQDINRISEELALFPRILLQVNVAGESSKFGFSPKKLIEQIEQIAILDRLQIDGLMTIPPLAPTPEHSRKYFIQLRELRDKLQNELRFPLPHLSMGMSNDYRVAIEEGATFIRIGTAIFGDRS
jgi:PLP dependent protein